MRARDNPFRAERIEALRFRFDGEDLAAVLARFASMRHRGVLVGPRGSGKTSLREEIERALAARGWRTRAFVLRDDAPLPAAEFARLLEDAGPRDLLGIDGLDRLPFPAWRRLRRAARRAGGILATSHLHGRLPVLYEHRTSPALLRELVTELAGAPAAAFLADRCDRLFALCRGDIRACLRALYDEAAEGRIPL
ncbi:MAG TPA: hypothetical protein PKX48_02490 [Planctomycetota bacterium]|jgi:hypothetical protein|nr:hypothetical protein [Planctomycetota bacterium]OQC19932.1 MAG: hypothetical protein BWX69_02322 [Planctomycetes bacterium ADurb.Bin069]NMD35445.1 hypothetical protein [Planctomycetota bacterium]HNR99840.1 hypothetical protein [Planctomycetota bacterium]HNU26313.1 hypothetical protein [Planctomycetota bacterium]